MAARPESARRGRLAIVATCLVTAAAVALVYTPVLRGSVPLPTDLIARTGVYPSDSLDVSSTAHGEMNDLVWYYAPAWALTHDALREGRLPRWNPHANVGEPFFENPDNRVLAPLGLVTLPLPTDIGWGVQMLLGPLLAAAGTALLLRTLRLHPVAIVAGGVAYGFSGQLVAHQGSALGSASVWAPLVLWAVVTTLDRPRPAAVIGGALAIAGLIFSGHVEATAWVAAACAAVTAWKLLGPDGGSRLHRSGAIASLVLLGTGLAAIQLLPTFGWLASTTEVGEVQPANPAAAERALDFSGFTLGAEQSLGVASRDLRSNPNAAGIFVPVSTTYAGAIALAAAPVALVGRRRREGVGFALVGAGAASVAFGLPPVSWVIDALPVVSETVLARAIVVVPLMLVVVASIGISTLADRDVDIRRRLVGLAVGAIVGLLAGVLLIGREVGSHAVEPGWLQDARSSAGFVAVAIVLLAWFARRPSRASAMAVIAFVALDLTSAASGHMPFVDAEEPYPLPPPVLAVQDVDAESHRVAGVDFTLLPHAGTAHGFDALGGYGHPLRRHVQLIGPLAAFNEGFFPTTDTVFDHPPLLNLLNVRYLVVRERPSLPHGFEPIAGEDSLVLRNPDALDRAFLVPTANTVVMTDDEAHALARTAGFDPLDIVPVDRAVPPATDEGPDGSGAVSGLAIDADSISLMVRAPAHSLVVISDLWHPGWQARVDGEPTQVVRAYGALKAIAVPPGHHRIELRYQPGSIELGRAVSSVSAVALLGIGVGARVRRARHREQRQSEGQ